MNRTLPIALILLFFACSLRAQIAFVNRADLLGPTPNHSGVAIAVIDLNGDGRDDIVRLREGQQMNLAYQTGSNKPFNLVLANTLSNESQWGMCTADVDNNGFGDVLAGGSYDGIKIARANSNGSAFTVETLTQPSTFVQCVNFADVNNDGWLDGFVCHDDGIARIFMNNGTGTLVYNPMVIDLATVPASDNSGNYGSVWSDIDNDGDLDLYIAKCRQGVSNPADPRRINQLFLNNGDGTFTQDVTDVSGLRIGAQSWTADFGDVDNDGDFDCFITNHDVSSQLLLNDGAGHFTDVTAAAGLLDAIAGLPIQGVFRDFDNDGYVDILVAGSNDYLFRNNGDLTFSEVANPFDANDMESYALGDLNFDGFQDIYAGYAEIYTTPTNTPDALWLNAGNDNHFFGLTLRGVQSNRSAVGAKIRLFTPAGMQTREVRSGESYGISNSLQVHFGLGASTVIDSAVVYWPSGIVDVLHQPAADQYLTLEEGGCTVPAIVLAPQGPTTFCTGESVDLAAPAGYTYAWSNGATTATATVTESGLYSVTVTAAAGCTAVSDGIAVTVDPVEVPSITVSGDTTFCAGGSVTLTSSEATSYAWNTGDTSQSITVTQAGVYAVAAQGLCSFTSSAPVTIDVLSAATPVVSNDTIQPGDLAVLQATGDSVLWYDAAVGGQLVATGNTFDTLGVVSDFTLWVENFVSYDAPNVFTGQAVHQGSNFSGNTFNGELYFDAHEAFTLKSVKVYTTTAGARKIDLRTIGGTLIATKTVDIAVGNALTIELDFDVPAGTGYVLTTDAAVNQANLGSASPRLRRSDQGVAFPYDVPGTLTITGSNGGPQYYYYFYDWEIDFKGYECISERVPVSVIMDTGVGTDEAGALGSVKVFPNPASTLLNVDAGPQAVTVRVFNAQGAQVRAMVGSGRLTMPVHGLAKGAYWLEVTGEAGQVRTKVVVQ